VSDPPRPPAARPTTPSNLPPSLPEAMCDLVLRHDQLHESQGAAARAFLARLIDQTSGRALDLTPVFVWVKERAGDDKSAHEIVLSLSAVAHALRTRIALPNATVVIPPAERARLLQAFVRRCPAGSRPASVPVADDKPTAPPPPNVDLDYLPSVVTSTLVRERRKQQGMRAGVVAGVIAAALGAFALFSVDGEETESEAAALPPPPADAPDTPPPGSKEARAKAAFTLKSAERALSDGALEQAKAEAQRARELDPDLHEALQVLSVVERRLGNADAACTRMKEYVSAAKKRGAARRKLVKAACDPKR
jgi:hypothetical protein